MKNNDYYTILFEELYNEFRKTTQLTKCKKNIINVMIFLFIIYILSQLICFFYKPTLVIKIIINIALVIISFLCYFVYLWKIKKSIKNIVKLYYDELNILLSSSKYRKINSLSKLEEFRNYLIQKQSSLLFTNNQKKSSLIVIVTFIVSTTVSYIFNIILEVAYGDIKIFVAVLLLIFIMVIVLWCLYAVVDIYNLYYKDDQLNVELLMNLITNQKLKILDSRDDNILNRVKYILKLGEFS